LPGSAFAVPGRRYPIENASHARNALSRVSQYGSPEERARVRAAVSRKFPAIGKKPSLSDRLTQMRQGGAFGRGHA
jgi:hypothetical protein